MNAEQQKPFLTVEETRRMLGSSRGFVYRQVENGGLTIHKVGSRSYFKTSDVQNLFRPNDKTHK